jgi:WD40 repeat protein
VGRRTGRERLTLRGHADDVMAVDFMPDGRRLVTASTDGSVKIWDLAAAGQ